MAATQTIAITGGTGFVGQHITKLLREAGHSVIVFSRHPKPSGDQGVTYASWNPAARQIDADVLRHADAVIHLAGAGVADKRWTKARKAEILSSRVDATYFLHKAIQQHAPGCRAFVAASATGYYGPDRDGHIPFTEDAPPYNDFLADVCRQWEAASLSASDQYRSAVLRIGIVLGKEGGAYPKLAGPMAFGIMPILGSGRQVVSWIHVDDLARLFIAAALEEKYTGIYNAVAPQPVTNRAMMQAIAKAKGHINIPAPVPAFVLQIILGDASVEVLKSCTVSDAKAAAAGFRFQYTQITDAVQAIISD